jgi:inhibitor of growth protein 4
MSEYQPYCIPSSFRVTDLTNQVFPLIGKIDEATDQLSTLLENKADAWADLDSQMIEANTQRKPSVQLVSDEEQDIGMLRKTIDVLSTSKIQLVTMNYDLIDHNIKLVDSEIALLEKALIGCGELKFIQELNLKETDRVTPDAKSTLPITEKKRKYEVKSNEPVQIAAKPVDPNEPVYCICNRIAFGDMVACDNEECPIEWFHYACVNVIKTPLNAWLCPICIRQNKR